MCEKNIQNQSFHFIIVELDLEMKHFMFLILQKIIFNQLISENTYY